MNEAMEWLRTSHGNGVYFSLQALSWRLSKLSADGNDGRHAIVVDRNKVESMSDDQVERHRWPVYPLSTLRVLGLITQSSQSQGGPTATPTSSTTSASTTRDEASASVTFAPLYDCVARSMPGVHMVILLLQSSTSDGIGGNGRLVGAHIRFVLPAPEKMDALLATMDAQKIPLLYELLRPIPVTTSSAPTPVTPSAPPSASI
jgi:hypothetical protein